MGCAPSLQLTPTRGFCCGRNPGASPLSSSNHLLHTGTSTNQSTPSRPDFEKVGPAPEEQVGKQSLFTLAQWPFKRETKTQTLLVFSREDALSEAWKAVCRKQGHDVQSVFNADDAIKVHLERPADMIVVDARNSNESRGEFLCTSIKSMGGASPCIMVALVKKNAFDRNPTKVNRLLQIGFNRVITESSSLSTVTMEITQLERNELILMQQQQTVATLLASLDSCKDLIHITDTQHRIKHVNRACENSLGYSLSELYGRNIWELHGSDIHRQDARTTPTDTKVDIGRSFDRRHSLRQRGSAPNEKTSDLKDMKGGKVNIDISEAVNLQMRRGKEWEGMLSCRRKSGDVLHLSSRVTPVALYSRKNDFYVYWSDGHHGNRVEVFYPRGSIRSHRKGSIDVRSLSSDGDRRDGGSMENELHGGVLSAPIQREKFTFSRMSSSGFREGSIIRRQSVAKLQHYMMEAPINRVVNIISAAQDNCPAYISQALEKVLEILRSSELYNPQILPQDNHGKPIPAADPVTTDLLGALLSHSPKPLSSAGGRRGSSAVPETNAANRLNISRPSLPSFQQHASSAIKEILAEDLSWTFDVIRLEKLTDKRPLVWLGMSLMCRLHVPRSLECDEQTLQNWLTLIEANYQAANSYHNSTHASDVLQTIAYFLERDRIKDLVGPLDAAACLIAAAAHDVDHPGKNSQFLCNTNNELAILYNDTCVLESHHAAVTFKLTASDDRVNILKGLDHDSYKFVRKTVIDMILATDMARHFEHVNKFINLIDQNVLDHDDTLPTSEVPGAPQLDLSQIGQPENLEVIRRMMIKCADINNPLRPLHLCQDWAKRIANEYFNQTEEEKRRSIPVVMPQFDRTTCSIPKSQIGFIDFFIFDMFEAWHELADVPELMEHLKENYQYWKAMEEVERRKISGELQIGTDSLLEEGPEESGVSTSSKIEEDVIVEELSDHSDSEETTGLTCQMSLR